MKNDEMTICQCCEYLSNMIDDEQCLECIDYIEKKAKRMSDKLTFYKEKQIVDFERSVLFGIISKEIETINNDINIHKNDVYKPHFYSYDLITLKTLENIKEKLFKKEDKQ